jgi:deoxycytidylate deaminase
MKGLFKKGYFFLAKNVSKYSNMDKKLGAVIVRKKPISIGFNIGKSRPSNDYSDWAWTNHAEYKAVLNAGWFADLKGCIIYVYREHADGTPALARPCNNCIRFLTAVGIKRMYYTVNEYPYWLCEELPLTSK